MSKIRYREAGSLYLNIQGHDATPLTALLEEHGVENGGAIATYSGGAQYFIEVFDWIAQHPEQVKAICAVLVALVSRVNRCSVKAIVEGKQIEINNLSEKSATALGKELSKGPVQQITVDLRAADDEQD
ncbi:hypothetical protein SJU67_17845 [Aeromonas caviae]|uniref:hypothetical protein n=1 Tax=Aeromonas caviae TaxID=648 RepID=UPI0029D932E3|nr:hypothetical protein [Aeromonas caviae]MDX7693592.1 hypothetical protein [Aeromonas caviae]